MLILDPEAPPPALPPVLAAADVGFDPLLAAVLVRILWRDPANRLIFPLLLRALALADFAFFFAIHAPMLLRPRIDGKPG